MDAQSSCLNRFTDSLYGGKVKCIYIDPPYNTGNEGWVYNDNVKDPRITRWLGQVVGKEAEDLSRHDKWLCMMYPRLALLREFLSPNGVLWVSMDESEPHLLRSLLDDVFGRQRFLSTVIWKKRSSPDARATIGNVHDYLLCYVKDPTAPKQAVGRMELTADRIAEYKNPDSDPRGLWASVDMTGMTGRATDEQYFKITLPSGRVIGPPEGRSWGLAEATFKELRKDDRIWFGKKGDSTPRIKVFLTESRGQVLSSFWDMDDVGSNDSAKKEVNDIMGVPDMFDTPKPSSLLERIVQVSTAGDKNAIVMDSFAGSGTTAHAVLRMNNADGGNRKFICVEMDPTIAQEITRVRLQRVVEGYHPGGDKKKDKVPGLGGGFQFVRLGPTMFKANGTLRDDGEEKVTFADLAAHIYFSQTGEPLAKVPTGKKGPLIGTYRNTAFFLLYNGVLGDRQPKGGNVLTRDTLKLICDATPGIGGVKELPMARVVFGEACILAESTLRSHGVTFYQLPYRVDGFPAGGSYEEPKRSAPVGTPAAAAAEGRE